MLTSSKGSTQAWVNVSCYVTYTVNGDGYGTNMESRWQRYYRPRVISSGPSPSRPQLTIVEQRIYDWMSAHPEGTEIYVRYNPSNRREISVVGMDPVIDIDPVRQSLRDAGWFTMFGMICGTIAWGIGRIGNQAGPSGMRSLDSAA